MSLEKSETNSFNSLICREDERDSDERLPQRNPEPMHWRSCVAPEAGCHAARRPGWKHHLADKTLVSGRGWLDFQHYSAAEMGEREQWHLGLHLPAKSIWYEEGWDALSGLGEAFRFETCSPLHSQTHATAHSQVTQQPFETFLVHQVQRQPAQWRRGLAWCLVRAVPRCSSLLSPGAIARSSR